MIPVVGKGDVNLVRVHVANGRTKTADEWAKEITDKIISIAPTAPESLKLQAYAFRDHIFRCVRDNLQVALQQERDWVMKHGRVYNSVPNVSQR